MATETIVLIGFMGVGKTSIGTFLARKTKVNFCDTDRMITKSQAATPQEIFQSHGEVYFRQVESKVLAQALTQHGIISTGGGIVELRYNLQLLRQSKATIVYLYGDLFHLMPRLLPNHKRPLIEHNSSRDLFELWQRRDKIYRSIADLIIDTTGKRNNVIAAEVKLGVALWQRHELSQKEIATSSQILSLERKIANLNHQKQILNQNLINHRYIDVINRGFKRGSR